MGKKYFDTKEGTLESSVLNVWAEAAKKSESMDKVNPKALKKDFDDRKDKDIDNDGDVDDSDEYLHNRRKTVSKAVKNEGLEDKTDNPANSQHLCAKNVVHEDWGTGQPVHGQHADPDENGEIAWYDVMFEHGIEKGVSINELKVTVAEKHENHNKDHKGKEVLKAKKHYGEEIGESYELGTNEYRDHALDTTPGQSLTWGTANAYKQAAMKEALAKVWGLDEKVLDKSEESDTIAPVKGKKSMTGGKVADVAVDPEMKDGK